MVNIPAHVVKELRDDDRLQELEQAVVRAAVEWYREAVRIKNTTYTPENSLSAIQDANTALGVAVEGYLNA